MATASHQSSNLEHLNRLASAKSPYLLQHAANPVDWYEWTPEAFALAKERDVPIFLSIGYSACHWCHVLAHESFENKEVAETRNKSFVNIKVDREERPDVDAFYMTFLQATQGGGGWPLSVFLTPDLKPFFAGTYFPKGRFMSLLDQIATLWADKREDVLSSADSVLTQLKEISSAASGKPTSGAIDLSSLAATSSKKLFEELSSRYDVRHGGFSERGPKFPSPAQSLNFLAAYASASSKKEGNAEADLEKRMKAAEMAVRTLRGIWKGGIRDHVGGGVARYSVDERWHVPHFEKMLYDQAQLSYTALSLATLPSNLLAISPTPSTSSSVIDAEASAKLVQPVRTMLQSLGSNILVYAESDLLDNNPENSGGFWSAEDADSKEKFNVEEGSGERKAVGASLEGAFYVFTAQEIDTILADQPPVGKGSASEVFKRRYGVKISGNVDPSSDVQGELTGKNILYEATDVASLALEYETTKETVDTSAKESLRLLKEWRDKNRPRPHLDDKIVLGWNGLMISSYCLAATTLPTDGRYPIQSRALIIAEGIANFAIKNMVEQDKDGQILSVSRTWRAGHKGPQAQADDHAFFIQGLLDLYEASGKESYLLLAIRLQERQDELFWDAEHGGYFTSVRDEHVLLRQKDAQDGAEPSALSITLSNLVRLSHFDTANSHFFHYTSQIEHLARLNQVILQKAPRALASSVAALLRYSSGYRQYIVTGNPASPKVQAFLDIIRGGRGDHSSQGSGGAGTGKVIIHIDPLNPPLGLARRNEVVKALVEELQSKKAKGDTAENVRLCEGFTCRLPVSSVEDVAKLVHEGN